MILLADKITDFMQFFAGTLSTAMGGTLCSATVGTLLPL